jgi:hypothetical protein
MFMASSGDSDQLSGVETVARQQKLRLLMLWKKSITQT